MADEDTVRRQVNLTFALLGSHGRRTVEWVGANVDGYEGRTNEALRLAVKRDVKQLRELWVPVHFDGEAGEVWLNKDQYELAPVNLTEAEASVIGLAADLAKGANLGAFARSGWTKLAASGATRTFDATAIAAVSNDITRLDPTTLKRLLTAVRKTNRIWFDFQSSAGAPVQRRTVDPWGIVPLNNRTYLVGWDVDKQAERVFRVHKISRVEGKEVRDFTPSPGGLQELVERMLRGPVVDAVITVTGNVGDELAGRGVREGATIRLKEVERDWVVRTTASLAGNLVSVEPEDVRRDVVALLKEGL